MGVNDYGIKVWNEDGELLLDVGDTIGRRRYTANVDQNADGNTTLSDISGKSTFQFAYDISQGLMGTTMGHLVTRSGTTISWTNRSGPHYEDSQVFVIIYD